MDPFSQLLDGGSQLQRVFTVQDTLLSLLLAFLLGQGLAWTYALTHRGLSYSRAYVQSLILLPVVVSMVMSTVANSLIAAVGLFGAMALIRFRNMLKDTRDTAFLFGAIVAGMAAGAQRHSTAVLGTAFVCACAGYLHAFDFGGRQVQDAFLQFRLRHGADLDALVSPLLERFCRSHTLLSVRPDLDSSDTLCAYQLRVRSEEATASLVRGLEALEVVREVSLTVQEPLVEV